MNSRLLTLFFVCFLISFEIKAQGIPLITNYAPEDYGDNRQIWTIVQDTFGNIIFGNSSGLVKFNGNSWESIHVKTKGIVRSTLKSSDGTLYYGARNDFGAMLGQSLINVSNGARARLSGIVAAVALLLFVMFGAGLIELLPMAALTGLMIMVAEGTFEWASLRTFNRMPKSDIFVMLVVTLVTIILHNLALAVIVGVIIAALVFSWDNAKRIRARKSIDEDGAKHYEIYGPLFFGSIAAFNEKFDILNDPDHVVIDFKESRVVDMSAIEALNKITERYHKVGKKVHLRHLSRDCQKLLKNADQIIEVNVMEDPNYKLVVDKIE